jgi:hypothetical protein
MASKCTKTYLISFAIKAKVPFIPVRLEIMTKTNNSWVPVAHTVILATQEAEIRRIVIPAWENSSVWEILYRKKKKRKKNHKNRLVEWFKV